MGKDTPTSRITQQDAEQRVLHHLQTTHVEDSCQGYFEVTLEPSRTLDLGYGWVVFYHIRYYSNQSQQYEALHGAGGPYFVDKATGFLVPFGPYPSYFIQGTVYQARHGQIAALSWPQIFLVDIAAGEHLIINLVPETTLCGILLDTSSMRRLYGTLRLEEDTCIECLASLRSLGSFCINCGILLRDAATAYCVQCAVEP